MDEKEKKAQEMYMEFQGLDQNIKQLQSHLEMVTQQLMELSSTRNSLDDFKNIKEGKEVFVPLSSGIFAKASISSSSELLVNVGANTVVAKNVDSTKSLIEKQIDEIKKIHLRIVGDLEKMTNRAGHLEMELQKIVSAQQV